MVVPHRRPLLTLILALVVCAIASVWLVSFRDTRSALRKVELVGAHDGGNEDGPFDPAPREDRQWWMNLHARFVDEVNQLVKTDPNLDLLFYGDSITEFARGESMGTPAHHEIRDVWQHVIGDHYKSQILAISGDQTSHLLWRIQNGELSDLKPKIIIILIGTNDLGYAIHCTMEAGFFGASSDCSQDMQAKLDVAARRASATIALTVNLLLERLPRSQILLQAVLPRGRPEPNVLPNKFTPPINYMNQRLQSLASSLKRVNYVDCNADFVSKNGSQLIETFIPDLLHPSPSGEVFMLTCLKKKIQQMMPAT